MVQAASSGPSKLFIGRHTTASDQFLGSLGVCSIVFEFLRVSCDQVGQLIDLRLPAGRGVEQKPRPLLDGIATFKHRPLSEAASGFDILRIVQEQERLQRRVGSLAADNARLRDGASKVFISGGGAVRLMNV